MSSTDPAASRAFDVVAIGNAIVDVLATASDEMIAGLGLQKGTMNLVDDERSAWLYDRMGPAIEESGGSAANTAAGVASLGGAAAFIGKVAADQLGQVFTHDLRASGVHYEVPHAAPSLGPTARSLILVTPDAERTMNTSLGVAAQIGADDVDPAMLGAAAYAYIEGYLVGVEGSVGGLEAAIASAAKVAATLSDVQWVEFQRDALLALMPRLSIVFGNETEVCALFRTDDIEVAAAKLAALVPTVVVTRSELGSIVIHEDSRVAVPAEPVDEVVDTTGAGDQFAAGYLFGATHGAGAADCARIGAIAAAEVISHVGARPQVPLATLLPASLR